MSLAVALAEAHGSYTFRPGAGVSRDVGVPTGTEVFWRAVRQLYRLENATEETPSDEELAVWLHETERPELGYSDVLELIAPDQATRCDYLAKHFEGAEPAATHERLAELAARGLVKVFVTTNFDRLLEHALQASCPSRGQNPHTNKQASSRRASAREAQVHFGQRAVPRNRHDGRLLLRASCG